MDLHKKVEDKLDDVISLIDEDRFRPSTRDLMITLPDSPPPEYAEEYSVDRDINQAGLRHDRARQGSKKPSHPKQTNIFLKVDLYMNSRLPVSLPPFRVYMPTWPLLCLAAQYSHSAYNSPQSSTERNDFVSADGRLGTKAMVIKSIPCDDKKTIVFAIRGTNTFSLRDWGVNLNTEPASPVGFLDDQGNLCHAGFLRVAKAMIKPIAARLRHLLEDNPSRTSFSLLITGHSAGGAVASLLYSHMLAETVQSELNILTGCFKRVHCVTFGAPPVSLLPLQKPETADGRLRHSIFHSFINEGDPVVRADRAYVKSLVDLLCSPVPTLPNKSLPPGEKKSSKSTTPLAKLGASMSRLDLSLSLAPTASETKTSAKRKHRTRPQPNQQAISVAEKFWWDVPPATLSNAGRLIALRNSPEPESSSSSSAAAAAAAATDDNVTASVISDSQLRQVIFGDPLAHSMDLYARRIEILAVRAVTGRAGAC